jgi:hypothetical protein
MFNYFFYGYILYITTYQRGMIYLITQSGPAYTQQMDTALRNTHGFGYKELRTNDRLRLKLEKRREEDYQMSKILILNL